MFFFGTLEPLSTFREIIEVRENSTVCTSLLLLANSFGKLADCLEICQKFTNFQVIA